MSTPIQRRVCKGALYHDFLLIFVNHYCLINYNWSQRRLCMHVTNCILCVGMAIRLLLLKLFPLVSYLMNRHCVRPRGRLYPSGLCLSAITLSSLGMARPFTNKVEKGWKKCTDPMVGGAISITLHDECSSFVLCHFRQNFYYNLIFPSQFDIPVTIKWVQE